MLVDGRIINGKYRFFPDPCEMNLIKCPRCGGSNHRSCLVEPRKDHRRVVFCYNPECLRIDRDASIKEAREDYLRYLQGEQRDAELDMSNRDEREPNFSHVTGKISR